MSEILLGKEIDGETYYTKEFVEMLSNQSKEKDKEIERLNNIINELEKDFEFLKMNSTGGNKEFMEDILDYIKALKELKGSENE